MPWPLRTVVTLLTLLAHSSVAAAAAAHDEASGRVTGLAVPRFVSLRSAEVNLRVGPGLQYPIDWVLQRRSLPVQIVEEFKDWRAIRLPDGTRSWVHRAMVKRRRSFMILAGPVRMLRAGPAENTRLVARLGPRVVGRILSCAAGAAWCQVQVRGLRGYLRRDVFWGTFAGEAVPD